MLAKEIAKSLDDPETACRQRDIVPHIGVYWQRGFARYGEEQE